MRIAVISDSHGDFRNVGRVRPQLGRIEWLLHAGDHLQDASRIAVSLGVDPAKVRAVAGNCDHPFREPTHQMIEFDGVRVLMTHGHHYGVKGSLDRLQQRAEQERARVVIFGHSHIAMQVEHGGILYVNPGSISQPRSPDARPSCGLLEIVNGQVSAAHIYV